MTLKTAQKPKHTVSEAMRILLGVVKEWREQIAAIDRHNKIQEDI